MDSVTIDVDGGQPIDIDKLCLVVIGVNDTLDNLFKFFKISINSLRLSNELISFIVICSRSEIVEKFNLPLDCFNESDIRDLIKAITLAIVERYTKILGSKGGLKGE